MTIVPGAAAACRRAAKFGVSPTDATLLCLSGADQIADFDESGRKPEAQKSDSAVVVSFGTTSARASPARTF
jgi:hypothetical protein